MADAKIKKKPTQKVSALVAPVRAGATAFKASWKNSTALFSTKSDHRFTGIKWNWVITLAPVNGSTSRLTGSKTVRWTTMTYSASGSSQTSATLNLASFTLSNGKKRSTANLYPNKPWRVADITIRVWGYNDKGNGPVASATRKIGIPKPPTIGKLTQGETTGDVTCTISCDTKADDGYQPRTNTRYRFTVIDTRKPEKTRKIVTDTTFIGNSKNLTYDVSDRQYLAYDEYVLLKVEAWSCGFGGSRAAAAPRKLYISWPHRPVIYTDKVSCPNRDSVGKVTIPINLEKTDAHPVTGVRLQKLVSVAYTKASQIPANAGWENCGVADDDQCVALSVESEDVIPEEGTHTWVRIKSWNQIEDIFSRYSTPLELTKLFKAAPTAENDKCGIVSWTSTADGTGAIIVVGFKNDGNTGSEITWSDNPDAWESTEQPKSFTFEWQDDASKSSSWEKTATVRVSGLTEGTQYYFKARRYLEGESGTTYSPWSAQKSLTPAVTPTGVVLSVPGSVRRGSGCEASWAYTGGTQRSWRLLSNGKVAASGRDQLGGCSISARTLEKLVDSDGFVPLSVEVTTAGGHAESDTVKILLAEAPSLELTDTVCTTQPLTLQALCSDENASLAITVRAQGCTETGPGQEPQVAGDVIWSAIVNQPWTAVEESGEIAGYSTTVVAPTGLDLRDGARYTVTASATDPESDLVSEEATCVVSVDWAAKAQAPVADVIPLDRTDEDGVRSISCEIHIGTPENSSETDLCDIWRVTPDGEYLVESGIAYGTVVTDPWAPYSSEGNAVAYRVVVRTENGDLEWADYPYELSVGVLRIDFDGTYLELPYNLSVSDAWEKDFESRRKLDGSLDGYWNAGVTRRSSYSSELVRITDAETAGRVKHLAEFAGACLLRSPDGACYTANVNVGDLSWAFTDVLMAVSLDATEVSLAPEYMAVVSSVPEEGE